MWAAFKKKVIAFCKKWWRLIAGFLVGLVLLLLGRSPDKWQQAKEQEIKERDKEIDRAKKKAEEAARETEKAKEQAQAAEKTLGEVREENDREIEKAREMPGRDPFYDPDDAARYIDHILRQRKGE